MAVLKYFTLTNSDSSLSKKFRVLHSGWDPIREKSMSVKKTLDGGLDISSGGIRERHEYLVRVSELDPEAASGFGSKGDLDTFFSYNSPNGTPSNRLTLTDHFGNSWIAVMAGDFAPKVMGASMEGVTSYFIVKCTFLFLSVIEGPS